MSVLCKISVLDLSRDLRQVLGFEVNAVHGLERRTILDPRRPAALAVRRLAVIVFFAIAPGFALVTVPETLLEDRADRRFDLRADRFECG